LLLASTKVFLRFGAMAKRFKIRNLEETEKPEILGRRSSVEQEAIFNPQPIAEARPSEASKNRDRENSF
jgi:hypothetical protein